jgi:dTDP-4-dehydrorhamnose reductase
MIAGAESPTGQELLELLTQQGVNFSLLPASLLQSADNSVLDQFIKSYHPDQLINLHTFEPGSQTALVAAETARQECALVQRDHPALLAGICERQGIPMLHLSTCYVFDGGKRLGYNEQDATSPVGVYGTTALQGELAVKKLAKHVIIRVGWTFGRRQYDIIESWIRLCKKQGGELAVLQRRFSPTPNEDVARVILAVCRQVDCEASVWGEYHYCGLETKTEIEFVQQVLKYASQHDEKIYQFLDNFTMSEVFPTLPEIANSTLSCKKIFDTFGIKQRSWHKSLRAAIKTIYQGKGGVEAVGEEDTRPSEDKPVKLPDTLSSRSLH